MNILGHPFVAYKITKRINPYLVVGSWLPDIVPFISQKVFTFEEIHEGGDQLLQFLDQKYPKIRDLALGMMMHSVKYGADKFNREIEILLLKDKQKLKNELAQKIAECSGINLEVANKYRLHNYLWSGVDLYLLKNQSGFVDNLAKIHNEINKEEIARYIACGFHKNGVDVQKIINDLLSPIRPELLGTITGLVKIWKGIFAGLPEKDNIDENKIKILFKEIYCLFEKHWPDILNTVIDNTRKRMLPVLYLKK